VFRNPLTDVIVVLVVVLLIFGPKRLPQLGRALGQGMREFKDGITGGSKDSEERQALTPGDAAQAPAQAPSQAQAHALDAPAQAAIPERDPAEVAPSDRG
jgi:sec-independent protein translocase protein TatA